MAGVTVDLARKAVVDPMTVILFVASLCILVR
jgi:hypothetical protein